MGKTYFGPTGSGENNQTETPNAPYEYEPGERHEKKKKRKKRRVIFLILELLILLIAAGAFFVYSKLAKMQTVSIPKSDIVVNEEIPEEEQDVLETYTNIALFGVDSREGNMETNAHSDTIIIASINNKTKEIKLASVYRDTYLDNTNGEYRKSTEAYYFGGAERAINLLNKNLDLDIDKFVTVDFNVVADVVDIIGGVDIDVTEEEVQYINGYQVEGSTVTGKEIVEISGPGLQTLNGLQALSYCRIRYTSGNDMKRTERQRTVLSKIFEKATSMNLATLNELIDTVFPDIYTNLSLLDMLNLAKSITSYSLGETTGFPFEYTTGTYNGVSLVVPVNLYNNVAELHEWLFGTTDYTPSSTVKEISDYIINYTGVQ